MGKPQSRRVTIPAGKEYVTFTPGTDQVFIISPGVEWPEQLQKLIAEKSEMVAKRAYEAGIKAKDHHLAARMYSPQESAVEALTAIRRHGIADQNKIVAIVLNEVAASRQNQVAAIQHDIEQLEKQLRTAESMQEQFSEIQGGRFVAF